MGKSRVPLRRVNRTVFDPVSLGLSSIINNRVQFLGQVSPTMQIF